MCMIVVYMSMEKKNVYVGKYVMLVNMVMCVYVIYVRCRIFVFFVFFLLKYVVIYMFCCLSKYVYVDCYV